MASKKRKYVRASDNRMLAGLILASGLVEVAVRWIGCSKASFYNRLQKNAELRELNAWYQSHYKSRRDNIAHSRVYGGAGRWRGEEYDFYDGLGRYIKAGSSALFPVYHPGFSGREEDYYAWMEHIRDEEGFRRALNIVDGWPA